MGRDGEGRGRDAGRMIVLMAMIPLVTPFNLEPREASIITNPRGNTDRAAYFGYSVALQHNTQDNANRVIIGAPRANSSFHDPLSITEPGVIYTCPLTAWEDIQCEETIVDPTGNEANRTVSYQPYKDLKNRGWLGGSVDSQPLYSNQRQATCVCSPLWKDQRNQSDIHVNGACYWTPDPLTQHDPYNKALPLVDRRKQTKDKTLIFAHGEAGFSVHFPDDSRKMVIGAPGVVNWTGWVIILEDLDSSTEETRRKRQAQNEKFYDIQYVKSDSVGTEGFLGYSLTSGFFHDPKEELIAVGAPRSADGRGKVVLFEYLGYEYGETSLRDLEGHQLGEYFGAALTAADINGDGLTDLVVGAPMYSDKNHDVGRIHVYLSEEGRGLDKGPLYYYGKRKSLSRFGLTLASADLTMDGYKDIVVGAPWEGGEGAVYVFVGSSEGLQPQYSQYITPAHFQPGLRGFGMALSRGIDVDDNGYPDVAIGSILSDTVALVRTRPIAVLSARVIATPSTVPFEGETSVTLQTCIRYDGHRIPPGISVEAILTVDHNSKPPRVVLEGSGTNIVTFVEGLVPNEEVCREHQVVVQEDKVDPDLAISTRLEYRLLHNTSITLMEHPVTNPKALNSTTTHISIVKGCQDKECKVDMWAEAFFIDGDTRTNSSVTIGKHNKLEIVVHNTGEHAYLPTMTVAYAPPLVVYAPMSHVCHFLNTTTERKALECALANPIKNTSEPERVELRVDVRQMRNFSLTQLDIEVAGQGYELNPKDNIISMELQLATQAVLELHGSSQEEQVAYKHKEEDLIVVNKNLKFNHTYILIKKGRTPLDTIDLFLQVPVSFSDGREFVKVKIGQTKFSSHFDCKRMDSDTVGNTAGGGGAAHTHTGDSNSSDVRPAPQEDKVIKAGRPMDVGRQYFNCSSEVIRCAQYACRISSWHVEAESARVTLELELDLAVLAGYISVQGGAVLGSQGWAVIADLDPRLIFTGKREAKVATVTYILPETPGGLGVPWWVILLAILIGLLLLGLLVYGMHKTGFFRRKKMEEMKMHRARVADAPTAITNESAYVG